MNKWISLCAGRETLARSATWFATLLLYVAEAARLSHEALRKD